MDSGLASIARRRRALTRCWARPGMTLVHHRALDAAFEVLILLAAGAAADQADFLQKILRLEHVALLDMPHAVILPGAQVVLIGSERALVPVFRSLIVAELARRVAEIVRDIGRVVGLERLEGGEGRLVVARLHQRVGGAIAVAEFLFGFLVVPLLFGVLGAGLIALRLRDRRIARRRIGRALQLAVIAGHVCVLPVRRP